MTFGGFTFQFDFDARVDLCQIKGCLEIPGNAGVLTPYF
jgi:hypothetical protein